MRIAAVVWLVGLVAVASADRPHAGDAATQMALTRETVLLAADRLLLEHTYPPLPNTTMEQSVDWQVLVRASTSPLPAVRAAFVRALGRFEIPTFVERIIPHMADSNRDVRIEAANAIAQTLFHAKPADDAGAIATGFKTLLQRLNVEADARVAEVMLEALGELPLNDGQAAEAEGKLLEQSKLISPPPDLFRRRDGAVVGLEALIRRHPGRPIAQATRARLRELSVPRFGYEGDNLPVLAALEALYAIRDTDERTILQAGRYTCPPTPRVPDCGWEIRRVAVQMMNGALGAFGEVLTQRLSDTSYLVRMEALRVVVREIPTTRTCAPLLVALSDRAPHVVLTAIDLMDPRCYERDYVAEQLKTLAQGIGSVQNNANWPRHARALIALTKFAPESALAIAAEFGPGHEVWQVRAAAANVAGLLKDEALALKFARDEAPNVRTEMLNALVRIESPARVTQALGALESPDYQLVLTAATVLKTSRLGGLATAELGAAAAPTFMAALTRLTADDKDTSRDPRVELLARIGELGGSGGEGLVSELQMYLRDVDPAVATAAADAIGKLTGARPAPEPTRRPYEGPSEDDLRKLPQNPYVSRGARIQMESGQCIGLSLIVAEAPLTVARFVTLADQGYYNGLTFHRVVPDFVLQGGSPGANEYTGAARFLRDEIGLERHRVGAVGISTRGRHTGDAQFFIDMVDVPRLNRDYTIFAKASAEFPPFWETMVEGAKIVDVRPGSCR
jgi:cyclophilin family peptidyl-prolyl cis-trans isomerase/HEAT repeat protein